MRKEATESKARMALTAARAQSRAHRKALAAHAATAQLIAERIEQERNAIGTISLSNLSDTKIIENTALLEQLINDYLRLTLGKTAR